MGNAQCQEGEENCRLSCAGLVKDQEKCIQRCALQLQCCKLPHPSTLGSACGNTCISQMQQCEAPCFFAADRANCNEAFKRAAVTCGVECSRNEEGCSYKKEVCTKSCPRGLKSACEEMCSFE